MANSDKDIVITPNRGSSTADPQIRFSGASSTLGPQNITAYAYPYCSGTVSFEGSVGQLFSIANTMSGTIFSVNDISGIPSIEVTDTGVIRLAPFNGCVTINNAPIGGLYCNYAFGCNALCSLTTGSNNFAVGYQALNKTTIGNNNTSIGYQSMFCNVTGNDSLAVGYQALYNYTGTNATSHNVAIGCLSLNANTTGVNNLAIGQTALRCNTIGQSNVAIGYQALCCNTTGSENVSIGFRALANNTIGVNNIAIGCNTLYCNQTGSNSIAIGLCSLYVSNTTGNNIGIGRETLKSQASGFNNIAMGYCALPNNSAGNDNIIIGSCAGRNLAQVYGSIAIGKAALQGSTSAPYCSGTNIAIGCDALCCIAEPSYSNIAIGPRALGVQTTGYGNYAIGCFAAGQCNVTGCFNTIIGGRSMQQLTGGTFNTSLGYRAAMCLSCGCENIAIGTCALYGNSSLSNTGSHNIAIGTQTQVQQNYGCYNIAIGCCAMFCNCAGANSIAIGNDALKSSATPCGDVAIGCQALANYNGQRANTAIGGNTLRYLCCGRGNTAVGYGAGYCNCSGCGLTAIGSYAGYGNKTGYGNTFLGYGSGYGSACGSCNIAIGQWNLQENISGNSNIAIGYQSMTKNLIGSCNIGIGYTLYNNSSIGTLGTLTGGTGYTNGTYYCVPLVESTGASFKNPYIPPLANVTISGGAITSVTLVNGGAGLWCYSANTSELCYSVPTSYIGGTGSGFYAPISTYAGGDNNIAQGDRSLWHNSIGSRNIALGQFSAFSNISGCSNIAIGCAALQRNILGNNNIAIGENALLAGNCVTSFAAPYGGSGYTNGTYNNVTLTFNTGNCIPLIYPTANITVAGGKVTSVVMASGGLGVTPDIIFSANSASIGGTGIGFCVRPATYSSGNSNIAIGANSLYCNIASNNIALGICSGCNITTGTNNTVIGNLVGTAGLTCTVLIGAATCERIKVDNNGLCVNSTPVVGLPTGGTTGQALIKTSNTNYDVSWSAAYPPQFVRTITASGSVLTTDDIVIVNSSSAVTLTMPNASTVKMYYIKNVGTGTVTINTVSSQTIDGDSNLIMEFQWSAVQLSATGTEWLIF